MATFLTLAAIALFVAGYTLIALEHKVLVDKSAVAMITGVMLWIIAAGLLTREVLTHKLEESGAEIFGIFIFLLCAMTLVEVLVHYQFFDAIRVKLNRLGLDDHKQFLVIACLTFFLSAILDNLTVTIVMIQISRRFFRGQNMIIAAAGIVILANAGGAWSPIGDVTTIMLWLAGKFTAWQVISQGFLPAAMNGLVAGWLLLRQLERNTPDIVEESVKLTRGEVLINTIALLSFGLPIGANAMGLQPYMGLMLGLGIVWSLTHYLRHTTNHQTHLAADIGAFLKRSDIPSLKFFVGILLAVAALDAIGLLETVSHMFLGEQQGENGVKLAAISFGLISALVDNVPLTALAIDMFTTQDPRLWVFMALCVGTGGSTLVIGSVPGVVSMGMVKELTFPMWLRVATRPALVGYAAQVTIALIQLWLW